MNINELELRQALTVEHHHKLMKEGAYHCDMAFSDACFKYGLDINEVVELRDFYYNTTGQFIGV